MCLNVFPWPPGFGRGVAVDVQDVQEGEGEMGRFFVVPFEERGLYAVVCGYDSHRVGWRWVMGWDPTAKGAESFALALNVQAEAQAMAAEAVAEREAARAREVAAGELLRALVPTPQRHPASRVDTRVSMGR